MHKSYEVFCFLMGKTSASENGSLHGLFLRQKTACHASHAHLHGSPSNPLARHRTKKGPTWGLFVEKWTLVLQRLLGKLNTAPSRTPAEGQRCVMVLRLV